MPELNHATDHEVIGADLPSEPPVWTAVVDANGRFYQRVSWNAGPFRKYVGWVGVGEWKHASRPSWMDLLNRGPVTVVWRPSDPEPDGDPHG